MAHDASRVRDDTTAKANLFITTYAHVVHTACINIILNTYAASESDIPLVGRCSVSQKSSDSGADCIDDEADDDDSFDDCSCGECE